jgi:hypothetical protein
MSYFTIRWLSKKSNVASLVRNGFLAMISRRAGLIPQNVRCYFGLACSLSPPL